MQHVQYNALHACMHTHVCADAHGSVFERLLALWRDVHRRQLHFHFVAITSYTAYLRQGGFEVPPPCRSSVAHAWLSHVSHSWRIVRPMTCRCPH